MVTKPYGMFTLIPTPNLNTDFNGYKHTSRKFILHYDRYWTQCFKLQSWVLSLFRRQCTVLQSRGKTRVASCSRSRSVWMYCKDMLRPLVGFVGDTRGAGGQLFLHCSTEPSVIHQISEHRSSFTIVWTVCHRIYDQKKSSTPCEYWVTGD